MRFWVSIFLAATASAASIKSGGAPLRTGCGPDAGVLRELAEGTEVVIRYSLAGDTTTCYKVSAKLQTGAIDGYLKAGDFEDLAEFESARTAGGRIGGSSTTTASNSTTTTSTRPSTELAVNITAHVPERAREAANLLSANQPARALVLLDLELKSQRDPGTLAVAGLAALQSDDPKKALAYFEESLKTRPDKDIEGLVAKVEQELSADLSAQRLTGTRVTLRYEGTSISAETARGMMKVVDEEYSRISLALGCNSRERIVAIAQSRDAYFKTTNAAEWSGGQYDGRIRVPVNEASPAAGMDAQTRRTLAHETTHACLAMLGQWPAWVQEGMAQYMSGDRVDPQVRTRMAELARDNKLPPLQQLGPTFANMDAEQALVSYAMALRAIEILANDEGMAGLRNLLRNPARLAQTSADLDRKLGS